MSARAKLCCGASKAEMRQPVSHPDRVFRHHVAIERRAELRRPGLGLEIHVIDAKTLFKSENPFEIIHQAPQEIAPHRHALGCRALQLREVIAQEHDTVEIAYLAVRG